MGLNAMLDRNQELVASLGRVSDSIAHELRTPLARLHTRLEQAAGRDGMSADQVDQARAEVERLQHTFDALLRIARLDTGRHRITRQPVQLDELIGDAVEFYEPEAEARRLKLRLSVTPSTVAGDRNLLFQAVSNLLDNAIKFGLAGGDVSVDLTADQTHANLTVTDSGPGVGEDHFERLTEQFFRAPGREGVPGTGLGLSLVKAIAAAHDGKLSFGGRPGAFKVMLAIPRLIEQG